MRAILKISKKNNFKDSDITPITFSLNVKDKCVLAFRGAKDAYDYGKNTVKRAIAVKNLANLKNS